MFSMKRSKLQSFSLLSKLWFSSHSKKLLNNPKAVRFGWSKEVVSTFLPFTSDLVSSRGRSYENIGVGYCPSLPVASSDEYPQGARRMDDSWLEIVLPFSDQKDLRESMMRDDRETVTYGKLFELLDALAGDVGYRHCGGRSGSLTIVTASVDGMKNFANITIIHDMKLQGYITFVGKSSMEVTIDILAIEDGVEKQLAETRFIMVARDGDKAKRIPGLLLANEEARLRFEQGMDRARTRRIRALHSLSVSPPRPEEVHLIHDLYLKSLAQRRMNNAVVTTVSQSSKRTDYNSSKGNKILSKSSNSSSNSSCDNGSFDRQNVFSVLFTNDSSSNSSTFNNSCSSSADDAWMVQDDDISNNNNDSTTSSSSSTIREKREAVELVNAASEIQQLQQQQVEEEEEEEEVSVINRWMIDTIYKSAQLMHIQNRNIHGKIFGGYIMKEAFEIAYVAAVCFFGQSYPHFMYVDDIQFVKPMNVGSISEFTSTVVYSSGDYIVIQVLAVVVDPVSGDRSTTNVLNYVFRSSHTCSNNNKSSYKKPKPQVLPRDYDQIVLYLEGKRSLDQMLHPIPETQHQYAQLDQHVTFVATPPSV